jgi:hypothetical protein
MFAWFGNIARKILEPGARQSSSTMLLADDERRFSLLGTNDRSASRDRPEKRPFPKKLTTADNDWRVLP